jgi:hypothetical protein
MIRIITALSRCGIGGMNSFDLFKKGEGWYPRPVPRY